MKNNKVVAKINFYTHLLNKMNVISNSEKDEILSERKNGN